MFSLFDFIDSEENFQDGIKTKYILLPINKDGVVNEKTHYSSTKCRGKIIVVNNDGFRENLDIISDIFIIDYNTMFGLRLWF
jgi:hypothetical protein